MLVFASTKKKYLLILFVSLFMLIAFQQICQPTYSNPVIIDPDTWTNYLAGGILPENVSNTLRMDQAIVNFEIQTGYTANLKVDFNGIYYVHNNEATAYYTIANPFSSVFDGLEETIEVEVNGIEASYNLYETGYLEPTEWEDYLDEEMRIFIISNISFEEDTTTKIEYRWSSTFKTTDDFTAVKYDVGTAKAWSNTLNERIEFKVRGTQPDRVTSNFEYDRLEIMKKTFYKLYIWNWELEFLNANEVGLIFKVDDLKRTAASFIFSYCIYFLLPVNLVLFIRFIIRKKRLRGAYI